MLDATRLRGLTPVQRETAIDAIRGRLLQLGAGLVIAGGLVYTGLTFRLNREGHVTDRYTKAIDQLRQPDGVKLTGADLTGADLHRALLIRADLADTNLTGANLTGANLAHADLTNATLDRTILADADLTGAKLPLGFAGPQTDTGADASPPAPADT